MANFESTASACIPAKRSKIVFEQDNIQLTKDKHPALVLGFLGSGLVGNIVVSEMIKQLDMQEIGHVVTEDLPPIAIFKEGVLQHPFRLYYCEQKNVLAAICEVPFNQSTTYFDLARLLTDWALSIEIDEVCAIQGLAEEGMPQEHPVYVAAEKEIIDRITKSGEIETLPKGLIMGPEAAVLNEGLNNKLNCYALLTPVNAHIPAPGAAGHLINKLNSIYDFGIEPQSLFDESEKIQEKLMELSQRTEQSHNHMVSLNRPNESNQNIYL